MSDKPTPKTDLAKRYGAWSFARSCQRMDGECDSMEAKVAEQAATVERLLYALHCWPLKKLLLLARATGNDRMATLFEQVREVAINPKQPRRARTPVANITKKL